MICSSVTKGDAYDRAALEPDTGRRRTRICRAERNDCLRYCHHHHHGDGTCCLRWHNNRTTHSERPGDNRCCEHRLRFPRPTRHDGDPGRHYTRVWRPAHPRERRLVRHARPPRVHGGHEHTRRGECCLRECGQGHFRSDASASSPAIDACALLTGPEASTAMGESYSQAQNTPESPADTTARLSGYSSASCVFAADASTPQSLRAVQVGTLRRTPATNPPMGTGTYATIDKVWRAVTQQAQGSAGNPRVLMGVGDEAIVIDDTTTPGDEDVYARKGSVLLLVTVTGYDMGARDKAIAVATQGRNATFHRSSRHQDSVACPDPPPRVHVRQEKSGVPVPTSFQAIPQDR